MFRHRHNWRLMLPALVCLLAITGPSSDVRAHEFDPEREVLVQVFADHVDVMVVYTEAPGERTELFRARYGAFLQDGSDGRVDPLAGRAVLPRVLDGLEFEVDGESPVTSPPRVKISDEGDRLQVASYVRYELGELAEGQRRTVTVRGQDRSFVATSVVIYGGDEVEPLSVRRDTDGAAGDTEAPVDLQSGHAYGVTFVRR